MDPIGASLQQRKDRGAVVTTVLRDTYSNNGRYYFKLSVKEPLQQPKGCMSDTMSDSEQLIVDQSASIPGSIPADKAGDYNPDFSFNISDTQKP